MLNTFFKAVTALSFTMSVLARLMIGGLVLLVVSDVVVRNLGLRPLGWAVNTSEILLLYITFLAMPWLVHLKGHVFVEFLRFVLPRPAQKVLEKLVYLASICLCLYLGYHALTSLARAVERGTYETRTFDIPKWVIFAPMVAAFGLSALEWLRFLLGFDTMYDRDPLEVGGH